MPKKRLGQHFLSDPHILESIVDFARVTETDTIVEIGPGRGSLTRTLARRARRVIAIEVDTDLVPHLRRSLPSNVMVLEADALSVDFTAPDWTPYHLVANLPYNIATPLIERFTAARSSIESLTIMVQKEVADRILAEPGSKQYGVLSAGVQYYAIAEAGSIVGPEAFSPPPKVQSRILRLTWRPGVPDSPELMTLLRRAFASRRKKLVNNLIPTCPGLGRAGLVALLEQLGIDPGARAENLSVDDFVRLHQSMTR